MDKQELKFLRLITNLPPNENPYIATAKLLESSIHPPQSPPWSCRLRIALLVLMTLLLFQSVYLLYQRIIISKRPKLKYDDLGLIILNVSMTSAVCYFSYSTLTIYTLAVQIALDRGHGVDESLMLLIFGIKFFTVITGAWAFIWVCACQCARLFWHSEFATNLNRRLLKIVITWSLTIFFLSCAFGPLPFIAWNYAKAYTNLRGIELLAHGIILRLRSEAKTYDPRNFSQAKLLALLIPAKQMLPLRDVMEKYLRRGQNLYLALICVMSLVYVPLLAMSLSGLYKQSVSQAAIDAAAGAASNNQPKRSLLSVRILRQRQRLVFHAFSAYLGTSVHLPVLICENLVSKSPGFSHTLRWHELTFQGLTIPLAFIGNLLLLILNLHAHMILQDRAHAEKNRMATKNHPSTKSGLNWLLKAGIFARELENFPDERTMQMKDWEGCGAGGQTRIVLSPTSPKHPEKKDPFAPGVNVIQLTSFPTSDSH